MKGQYFSFDAIIASVIFVMALIALLSYWYAVKNYLESQNDELEKEAIRISNLLLSPSYPSSDCSQIESLGLAKSWNDSRIDADIFQCQSLGDKEWVKEKLATGYGVSITVTKLPELDRWTIGGEPSPEVREVVRMHRFATLLDETDGSTRLAVIELALYR